MILSKEGQPLEDILNIGTGFVVRNISFANRKTCVTLQPPQTSSFLVKFLCTNLHLPNTVPSYAKIYPTNILHVRSKSFIPIQVRRVNASQGTKRSFPPRSDVPTPTR